MPAAIVSVNDTRDDGEEPLWQIFTDGSKSEQVVGSGIAVFIGKVVTEEHKLKLDIRCSNNQAEHLAVLKALEVIDIRQVNHNEHRTVVIYTDSKITLD
jgi:ribonuclease HI